MSFLLLTLGHTFGVRVDGAAPRGLWPPVGGGLCRKVVQGKVQRVVDCPSGDGYKISVTDSPFCVIWHDRHYGDWLAALAYRVEIIHPSHTTVRTVRYTAVQFLGQIIFS